MAFLGDALAHAVLPGVAVAYLVGANLLAGALVAGLLVAVGISYVSRAGTIREDTAIGIFFAAALALGVLLISTMNTYAVDLTHILFGNVLGVTAADLWIGEDWRSWYWRPSCCSTSGSWSSRSIPCLANTGLRTQGLRTVLFLMLAATIVVSLRTVGVALVAAMLITPPAAANILTSEASGDDAVSAGIGVVSAVAGLYASYYLNVATGSAMVLVATGVFVVVFLFAPERGALWRIGRRVGVATREWARGGTETAGRRPKVAGGPPQVFARDSGLPL